MKRVSFITRRDNSSAAFVVPSAPRRVVAAPLRMVEVVEDQRILHCSVRLESSPTQSLHGVPALELPGISDFPEYGLWSLLSLPSRYLKYGTEACVSLSSEERLW